MKTRFFILEDFEDLEYSLLFILDDEIDFATIKEIRNIADYKYQNEIDEDFLQVIYDELNKICKYKIYNLLQNDFVLPY